MGSDFLKQNNKAVECYREMTGDTIVVRRTDDGALRLYEVYPISKCVWIFMLASILLFNIVTIKSCPIVSDVQHIRARHSMVIIDDILNMKKTVHPVSGRL
jgi:hypothetical protein